MVTCTVHLGNPGNVAAIAAMGVLSPEVRDSTRRDDRPPGNGVFRQRDRDGIRGPS